MTHQSLFWFGFKEKLKMKHKETKTNPETITLIRKLNAPPNIPNQKFHLRLGKRVGIIQEKSNKNHW